MQERQVPEAGFQPQGYWRDRRPALRVIARIVCGQLLLGGIVAAAWLLAEPCAAAAAMFGVAIALLPTLYFAAKVFSKGPGSAPHDVLRALYTGEAVKLILTAALFVIALRWFAGHFLPLITAYAAALATYWFVLLGNLRS